MKEKIAYTTRNLTALTVPLEDKKEDFKEKKSTTKSFKKNNIGIISLICSFIGLIVIELLLYLGIVYGTFWNILEIGFEAATVGGLADWFAVSALFREIPIPFIKKHTNIIVKNRKKLTEGASELVVTKWLSSEGIKNKLKDFQLSHELIEKFKDPKFSDFAINLIRDILLRFTSILDKPDVKIIVKNILNDQIKNLELSKPLGIWIKKSIHEGKHNQMWDMILETTKKTVNSADTKRYITKQIRKLIEEYASEGMLKGAMVWIAESVDALDQKLIVNKLFEAMNNFLEEVEENPTHKFREKLNNVIIEFSDGLITGKSSSISIVNNIKENMINNEDVGIIIQNALSNFKESLSKQLENNETQLMKLITKNLNLLIQELSSDKSAQNKIDEWLKNSIYILIDKNHHRIGDIVTESMNKFNDFELVKQIEDKVGNDLQYIRLNGAVVGGIAGIVIGILKFTLLR